MYVCVGVWVGVRVFAYVRVRVLHETMKKVHCSKTKPSTERDQDSQRPQDDLEPTQSALTL
jgi:hypothetical protein